MGSPAPRAADCSVPLSTPAAGWQEDVFIGELKFDDKEGNTLGCLRFAFSQLGLEEKEL